MCLIQRESLCANQNLKLYRIYDFQIEFKKPVMFLQVNFDLPLITCEKCFPEDKIVTSTFFSENDSYYFKREYKMSHYNRQFRRMTNKFANALK